MQLGRQTKTAMMLERQTGLAKIVPVHQTSRSQLASGQKGWPAGHQRGLSMKLQGPQTARPELAGRSRIQVPDLLADQRCSLRIQGLYCQTMKSGQRVVRRIVRAVMLVAQTKILPAQVRRIRMQKHRMQRLMPRKPRTCLRRPRNHPPQENQSPECLLLQSLKDGQLDTAARLRLPYSCWSSLPGGVPPGFCQYMQA